jgi:hypothetical protein
VSIDGEMLRDELAFRVGNIVAEERKRLARRRPEFDETDLAAVEDTLWRIADALVLRHAARCAVDAVAAARLWDPPAS